MSGPPRKKTPAPRDADAARLPCWVDRPFSEPQSRIPYSGCLNAARRPALMADWYEPWAKLAR